MTEINDSKHSHTFEAFQAEESEIFLSRILKLTKARMIYVMISVTLVQMILNIILQRGGGNFTQTVAGSTASNDRLGPVR